MRSSIGLGSGLVFVTMMLVASVTGSLRAAPPGFITVKGKHIHLVTDIDHSENADDWVASFDAAVPQWAAFWGLDPDSLSDWTVDAYVMRASQRFRDRGMLPPSISEFPFGTARGNRVWVHEQPSAYYTRHLLLHEGVHALMFDRFGGGGPTWFMEGTAEMLSVHQGHGEAVVVNRLPKSRESVPEWGRFKVMSARRDKNQVPSIETVMRLPRKLKGDVESYGWSWAAVMMLSQYPDTRDVVVRFAERCDDPTDGFTRDFYRSLAAIWPVVRARWAMMCLDLDYGFDWGRETIEIAIDDPSYDDNVLSLELAADQGWQSVGRRFEAGDQVSVTANGQVILNETVRPWLSLPRGVTLSRSRGRPIGQVIACVLPVTNRVGRRIELPEVISVGERCKVVFERDAWLMLRVNDAIDDVANNRGAYQIRVEP